METSGISQVLYLKRVSQWEDTYFIDGGGGGGGAITDERSGEASTDDRSTNRR